MLILVTPSRAAGRYSSSSTPRALGSNFPPAALMPELVTREKRAADPFEANPFVRGQFVGVDRIDRRKMRAFQPVDEAVDLDGSSFTVDSVHQAAMIHLPFWVAVDGLPFELEL